MGLPDDLIALQSCNEGLVRRLLDEARQMENNRLASLERRVAELERRASGADRPGSHLGDGRG